MSDYPFGRLITAMATPFHEDGSVNYDAVNQLATHLVDTGSDGLLVTGTTGESPTLTHEEKLQLYRAVNEAVGERAQVIAGTGNYNTAESVELSREAEEIGVHGLVLVVPYYNNPPQEGLYQHFKTIAESTSLPIILYNVPSRSPRNLESATTIRLSQISNIVGIKEASGNLEQIAEIAAGAAEGFQIYSGDDSATLPIMAMGGYGVVSVASHIAGAQIKQMMEAFVAGNVVEAAAWHGRLLPLFQACFCTTNPIPIKAGVNLLGIPAGGVRLPLVAADDAVIDTMRREMQRLEII